MPRAAVAALLLALATGASACGGGSGTAHGDAADAAGADRALPAAARRAAGQLASFSVSYDLASGGSTVRVDAEGIGTLDGRRTELRGTVGVDGGPDEELRLRVIGPDAWQSPDGEVPFGVRWVHVPVADADEEGLALGAAGQALRTAQGVVAVDHERLDGEAATHYRGRLPAGAGRDPGRIDAWLDARGRLRRATTRRTGDGTVETVTHDVLEYGGRFTARRPAQNEVIEREDEGAEQG